MAFISHESMSPFGITIESASLNVSSCLLSGHSYCIVSIQEDTMYYCISVYNTINMVCIRKKIQNIYIECTCYVT